MPLGELEKSRNRKDIAFKEPEVSTAGPTCAIHIQIGMLAGDQQRKLIGEPDLTVHPNGLAVPSQARIVVTCLEEICPHVRVRRALSYDSIVVDLLRVARGYGVQPEPTRELKQMIGEEACKEKGKPPTFVVIRINNTAALLYKWDPSVEKEENEEAWILYHKDRAAPIIDPGKGKMVGYNTRIGAVIASHAWKWLGKPVCYKRILVAVRRTIIVQHMHFTNGFGKLARGVFDDGFISADSVEAASKGSLKGTTEDVKWVKIDIADAVARHTQWFITKNISICNKPSKEILRNTEDDFHEVVQSWLCENRSPKDTIPTVSIKGQLLVDRREIEDYLSLRLEMIRYANDKKTDPLKRPLNLAVFGPPGSGKSFGIKQITEDILEFGGYDNPPLEFNLSQFTSLEDYSAAFHQVRDSCLKGKVPIVFFDEFDSHFQGVPFGWLKYFLAPMQDSDFTDKGRKYKLGPCVLVFAGGVNRSFEEFAGRARNPAFIEAKGPDFMSRLRDHINVRGINRPDKDDHFDQGRYLLRRGAILHSMLCKRLRRRKDEFEGPLLHERVARAFLKIARFHHGVRSMEAILDMSMLRRGETLGPSELPPLEQLDMHVNGREFLDWVRK
jgi:hypothetical protein